MTHATRVVKGRLATDKGRYAGIRGGRTAAILQDLHSAVQQPGDVAARA
jgi:hypothetical protein